MTKQRDVTDNMCTRTITTGRAQILSKRFTTDDSALATSQKSFKCLVLGKQTHQCNTGMTLLPMVSTDASAEPKAVLKGWFNSDGNLSQLSIWSQIPKPPFTKEIGSSYFLGPLGVWMVSEMSCRSQTQHVGEWKPLTVLQVSSSRKNHHY